MMIPPPIFKFYRGVVLLAAMSIILQGCFLCPSGPDVPAPIPFTPTLEWLKTTRGVVMDVSESGRIVCAGDTTMDFNVRTVVSSYSPEGALLFYTPNSNQGLVREVLDNYQDREGYIFVADSWDNLSSGIASLVYIIDGSRLTLPYTRYNTVLGTPDTDPYPWSGYRYVVGSSIAKGPKRTKIIRSSYTYYSIWMVGAFTNHFNYAESTTPGKADCFVRRYEYNSTPVHHQWGGTENDLAYDVASDDVGNPTIFLRAGSDFGITSATQSIVRMKTGYNIVTLDTNGLLTKTYPVPLDATGEITDAKIALCKSGSVYILAYDEQRKQYFLAKVSSSGTAWTRYLPDAVSTAGLGGYTGGRQGRMDLCVDSHENVYLTGNFHGSIDLGNNVTLATTAGSITVGGALVVKYSPSNECLGALNMGSGMGVTIRLAPDETALYVNGWATGKIMGVDIPDQSDPRNGVLRPGAFLVKLKLGK